MMEAADLVVAYLEQIGVEHVFGVPGGAIEPLYNALARSARRGGPRPVVARHETGAAFMADGYARETGRIGVCCATSGPGSTNLITGVACAYENEIPLLVISGQPSLFLLGRGAMQESAGTGTGIDTVAMFRSCTRYSALVSHPDQLERQLASALLLAHQPTPGPVHLSIPVDVLRSPIGHKPAYDLASLMLPPSLVDDAAVKALHRQLGQVRRVVVLIGSGCGEAIDVILDLAEKIGAVFVTTPDAKGLVSPHHPLYRGVFGFAGHRSADAAMNDRADLILAVGSDLGEFTSNGWCESLLNGRLVHIDSCEAHLLRSPMARLHVRGRIRPVFERLLDLMRQDGGREIAAAARQPAQILMEDPAKRMSDVVPIKPQRLMHELGRRCPPNTRFLADTGNSIAWAIHHLDLHDCHPSKGGWLRVTMNFAPMGWAIGGAVGTALAAPKSPVVCLTGDGSLLMNGQEMTVALVEKLTVVFVILNDAALGMVKHGQHLAGAERVGVELPTVDFRLLAESMGIPGHVIRSAEDLERLDLDAILRHPGPTVLDVRIDGEEVPPMGLRIKILGTAK